MNNFSQQSHLTVNQLDNFFNQQLLNFGLPGFIAGIWIPSQNINYVQSFGYADLDARKPMDPYLNVRIASVSKIFTSITILKLAETGFLSLDDKLEKYIQNIPNGREINIRQLLNMTSGIYSYPQDPHFTNNLNTNPLMQLTINDVIQIINSHSPASRPGEAYHYTDSAYYLLGLIIEKVTNQPANNVILNLTAKPLNMRNTYFPVGNAVIPGNYSRGYTTINNQLRDVTAINPNIAWTAGAIVSNLTDLKIWIEAVATGKLLSNKYFLEFMTFVPVNGSLEKLFGLGIGNIKGYIIYQGAIIGYNTLVAHNPKLNSTFVLIANKSTNESTVTIQIFEHLLRFIYGSV